MFFFVTTVLELVQLFIGTARAKISFAHKYLHFIISASRDAEVLLLHPER
jgi:hypothetical protein